MKALIVANWKMNPKTFAEAKKLFEATRAAVGKSRGVSAVVAPPALFLPLLSKGRANARIMFAAQNMNAAEGGAHTGEISAAQVKDARATHVIIGHAERRAMGETNEEARKKVAAALGAQLVPILCVGEAKRSPGGEHFTFIREQLHTGLADVPASKIGKIIIAYEPVWAIGATKAMSPRDMHEMSIFIRKTVVERFGDIGHDVHILYGGSIDAQNAAAMMRDGDVKGLLVGRASTDKDAFGVLLKVVAAA